MSAPSDTSPAVPAEAPKATAAAASQTRPFYWSVRRELWENRAVFVAPLAVAGVILFGGVLGAIAGPHSTTTVRTTRTLVQSGGASHSETVVIHGVQVEAVMTPAQRAALAAIPYEFVALALLVTMFLVAVFYCLGALHNERRDRSILFWKSLPVSDLTTVLAKAVVPLAILPPVALAVTLATQFGMLLLNTASLAAHGKSVVDLWTQAPLASMSLLVLYALTTLTLWWAPVYAWLMLISGWARRAPFLWAVLPPLLVAVTEKIAFNTQNVWSLIVYRVMGGFRQAFVIPTQAAMKDGTAFPNGLPQLDPGKFLSTPGLWIGLALAGAFFAACVWLRRYREPI